jgi:predicted NBD/HSP70 family sugar kinase
VKSLGLDLGGTNIKRVLLEGERIVERDSLPTRSEEGPAGVLARLAAFAREAGRVDSIGIALPGLFDQQGRGVLLPNLHGDWVGLPIAHHTVLEDGPQCGCGNRGCLETVAGARAIAAAAGQTSFDEVVTAARAGGEQAQAALRRAAGYIGIAIANLTIFLTPQRIVIGGGVGEAGELLFGPLREAVERRAGRVAPLHAIDIVPANLGSDAGAVGAALAGLDRS